ncbi:Transcription repressor OFP12 [Ananas comosus]|uniref:Transcription repressor n=1 Tax=Ananas comosus TaxID=4615 RepID=A0A199V1V8_ANACO|nr:Transcription repressor OFP12 [Ananas comosus]
MLGKGLHHCFSRLKRPSHSAPPPIPNSEYTPSTSASASSASVVFKNFNSLYDPTASSDSETLTLTLTTLSSATATATATAASSSSSSSLSLSLSLSAAAEEGPAPAHSPSPSPSERDLSTAIASRRFFPASPGRSKSIVDSAAVAVVGVGTGVAVPTYSPDPYGDFRRSMEEMVAALGLDAAARRTHLHELLLCYLALNSKRTHKYIIGAFADLLLGLAPAAAASEECLG